MFKIALRSVLLHKLRLTLTAVAIVLGVAFVSGTFVFTDSIKASFDDLFSDVNAQVDFFVRGTSEFGSTAGTMDESIVDAVRGGDGLDSVVPSVDGIAQLISKEGEPIGGAGPPTLGFSYLPEGEGISPIDVRQGDSWPTEPGQVVIDTFAAEANDLGVGDVIDVITPIGVEPFEIVGIATFGDADNLLGATLAVFEFEEAQRIFDMEGKVSSISLTAADGVDKLLLHDRHINLSFQLDHTDTAHNTNIGNLWVGTTSF